MLNCAFNTQTMLGGLTRPIYPTVANFL